VSGQVSEAASYDEQELERFGYRGEFSRIIKPFASFAVSVSNTSITTGVFLAVGVTFAIAGPAGLWVYLIDGVAMLFVGLVYATLSARMPVAGIEYQWGTRLARPVVGLSLGWLSFGTVAVSAVAVDYVLASTVLPALFGYTSSTAGTLFVCALIIVIQAVILGVSTRLTTAINSGVIIGELTVVIGLSVLLLIVGAVRHRLVGHNLTTTSGGSTAHYLAVFGSHGVGPFWLLLSVAFFSIADGFQGCANVVEETDDASRVVPRAMMQTLTVTIFVQMFFMIAVVLVSHNLKALAASPTTVSDVVSALLGSVVDKIFLVFVSFNVFACGMVIFLQATRYTWSMARDGRFPAARVFGKINAKTGTPVAATVLCFVFLLAILFIFGHSTESFNNLIAAGGLVAIVTYLLVMLLFAFFQHRIPVPAGRFNLGRWQWPVVTIAILWLAFCLLIFRSGFSSAWEYFGGIVGLGVIYVAWVLIADTRKNSSDSAEKPVVTGAPIE
jgi:amino acid transporter